MKLFYEQIQMMMMMIKMMMWMMMMMINMMMWMMWIMMIDSVYLRSRHILKNMVD